MTPHERFDAALPHAARVTVDMYRRYGSMLSRLEVQSAVWCGLWRAALSHDDEHTSGWHSYAELAMRGEVLESLRRDMPFGRGVRAVRIAMPLAETSDHGTAASRCVELADSHWLRRAMRRLTAQQVAVLAARYWCGEEGKGLADRLGVSPSWVSQLHLEALRRLREQIPPRISRGKSK